MKRLLIFLGLLFVYGSTAQAQTCTGANNTALCKAAVSLSPGQSTTITPTNVSPEFRNPLTYTDSGAWDPVNRKFVYCGEDEGQHFYEVPIYDETTNAFSRGPTIPNNPFTISFACAHQYDNTTIDTANGRMYTKMGGKSQVQGEGGTYYDLLRYNIAAGTWTTLPSAETVEAYESTCCTSQAYFPDRTVLFRVTAQGHILEFRESTQQWTIANGTSPPNWNNVSFTFAEYSPSAQAVFFGTSNRMWKYSSTGVVTQVANPPANLYGVGWGGNLTADPVTGQLVGYFNDGTNYYNVSAYNPSTNTWSALQNILPRPAFPLGGITSAPVSNYGVIVTHVCGQYSGACGASTGGGFLVIYKHSASGGGDTTPPTQPQNVVATVVSSSQINLTWNASTDTGGSGVNHYDVSRCSGNGCANFAGIATPVSNSYNDTGLSASTFYSYCVRATDNAGNPSAYNCVAQVQTQAGGGGLTPDQDYANRCAAPGVVKCIPFDLPSEAVCCSGNGDPTANIQGPVTADKTFLIDTSNKKSGAASLKFHLGANGNPSHVMNYSCCGDGIQPPASWIGNYVQGGQEFYFQLGLYMDDGYINGQNYWGNGSKILLIHENAFSCGDKEITMNTNGNRLAHGYFVCGSYGWTVNDSQGTAGSTFDSTNGANVYLQEGATIDCHYGARTNCLYWQPNKWQTVLLRIKTPTRWQGASGGGTSDAELDAWYAVDGQPYVQFERIRGINIFNCRNVANCATEAINNFTLSFHTNTLPGTPSPVEANVWFDEIIVSTQPIAAPGATSVVPPTSVQLGRRRIL